MNHIICERLQDSIKVKQRLIENESLIYIVEKLVNEIVSCINKKGKLVMCGNGGSASDALHFAGEIIGRFQKERNPWSAVVLNADVATLTAIANDYGYDDVFARQTEAHLTSNDIFIGISTSGNSENIYRAVNVAKKIGANTAALLGKDGGKIGKVVDYPIIIPCDITARIQESHITLIHIICELVEDKLCNTNYKIIEDKL
jgi:D-sedoheptulose 7-phosphate isomerase